MGIVQSFQVQELREKLVTWDVPFAVVNHPRHKVLTNEQVVHNKLVVEHDHPYTPTGKLRQTRPAAQFSDQPFQVWQNAPTLGQHTVEILQELGMGEDDVSALAKTGAIRIGEPKLGDGRVRRQGSL